MKTNKNTSTYIVSIICILLCLGAVMLGYLHYLSFGTNYRIEKAETVEISDYAELLKLHRAVNNDVIVLKSDIYITSSGNPLGNEELPFNGTFDGNGHTVYCNYKYIEDGSSIFGIIGNKGIIQNTAFSFDDATVNISSYGAIANINYGTIKNCLISFESMTITKNDGYCSPIVGINYGSITNTVVDCSIKNSVSGNIDSAIASVCSYNYGSLKNIISSCSFDGFKGVNEFNIISKNEKNTSVGTICAFNIGDASIDNVFAIVDKGTHTLDNDLSINFTSYRNDVFNQKTILDDLDFDNRIWTFANDKLSLVTR